MGPTLGDMPSKGASLRVLNMNLDTATPTGKLILNVLGSIAQFERSRRRVSLASGSFQHFQRGPFLLYSDKKIRERTSRA